MARGHVLFAHEPDRPGHGEQAEDRAGAARAGQVTQGGQLASRDQVLSGAGRELDLCEAVDRALAKVMKTSPYPNPPTHSNLYTNIHMMLIFFKYFILFEFPLYIV
jgi:hypothetical protein